MTSPYVINLEERTDRWEQIQKEWKGTFNLNRVPAVKETPGWKGCALSHIKIIEEAKSRGDPYVLVWEDDCTPRNRHPRAILELWNELLYKLSLHQHKWDIVLGATSRALKGGSYNSILSTKHVKVYDLPHGFTTHWILYNSSCYDRMIEYKHTLHTQIDAFIFQKFNVKVVTPFLAQQRESYSDIEGMMTNYTELFNGAENKLLNQERTLNSILKTAPQISSPKFIAH